MIRPNVLRSELEPSFQASDAELSLLCLLSQINVPMDLGAMRGKQSRGEYTSVKAFRADFELLRKNCRAFNKGLPDWLKFKPELAALARELKAGLRILRKLNTATLETQDVRQQHQEDLQRTFVDLEREHCDELSAYLSVRGAVSPRWYCVGCNRYEHDLVKGGPKVVEFHNGPHGPSSARCTADTRISLAVRPLLFQADALASPHSCREPGAVRARPRANECSCRRRATLTARTRLSKPILSTLPCPRRRRHGRGGLGGGHL